MKNWSRGDIIALFSLLVAIIACIAAVAVIPEVRMTLGLNSPESLLNGTPNHPQEVTIPTNTPSPLISPAPSPVPIVEPTSDAVSSAGTPYVQPTLTASFGEMRFCEEDGLDKSARLCATSQVEFRHPVGRINASWTYQNVYRGMLFSRKWYWNDQLIWEVEDDVWDNAWEVNGLSEYTFLDVSGGNVFGGEDFFQPGAYTVELYIGDELEQRGHFAVQE